MRLVDLLHERSEVVAALAEEPDTLAGVSRRVSPSRSTVHRALEELEGAGLAERGGDEYRLTAKGRVAHNEVESHARSLERLADAGERLEAAWELEGIGAELLLSAEFYAEEEKPLVRVERLIDRCDRLRALSGARRFEFLDALVENQADGTEIAVVAAKEIVDATREFFGEEMRRALDDGMEVYSYGGDVPFALEIIEGTDWKKVTLGLLGPKDEVKLLAVTEDPAAFEAAEELYEEYRRDSIPYHESSPISP